MSLDRSDVHIRPLTAAILQVGQCYTISKPRTILSELNTLYVPYVVPLHRPFVVVVVLTPLTRPVPEGLCPCEMGLHVVLAGIDTCNAHIWLTGRVLDDPQHELRIARQVSTESVTVMYVLLNSPG